MQVSHSQTLFEEVVGEILGHLLGEGGHEDAVTHFDSLGDILHEVVDLTLGRLHDHLRVDQPGRSHDLFHDLIRLPEFEWPGRRREKDALVDALQHLVELQRSVVASTREPESVLHEDVLATAVAGELTVQLRYGNVTFVDHEQEILGEVIEQGERRFARTATIDVHRVVLDAVAITDFLDHLEIVLGAHPQSLGLEQLAFRLEDRQSLLQFGLDAQNRAPHAFVTGHVMSRRENQDLAQFAQGLPGDRINHRESIDGVAEHLDPEDRLLVGRVDLDRVAPNPKIAATERHVVAVVLKIDQTAKDASHVVINAGMKFEELTAIFIGIAHSVDTRDGGDHDGVASGQKSGGGRMAEPIDVVVDRRVLLDVRVTRRDVGLGLVIVVVTHEVFDAIVGEELPHLLGQLCSETLVGGEDQRRSLGALDRPRDRGALARARDAEQGLVAESLFDSVGEFADRRRLITGRRIIGDHPKGGFSRRHSASLGASLNWLPHLGRGAIGS